MSRVWRSDSSARTKHALDHGRANAKSPPDLQNAHAFGPERTDAIFHRGLDRTANGPGGRGPNFVTLKSRQSSIACRRWTPLPKI
jgi:hypothetical protein